MFYFALIYDIVSYRIFIECYVYTVYIIHKTGVCFASDYFRRCLGSASLKNFYLELILGCLFEHH